MWTNFCSWAALPSVLSAKHRIQPSNTPSSDTVLCSVILFFFKGVLKKSDGWVGLGCCELAIVVECRQACKQVRINFWCSMNKVRHTFLWLKVWLAGRERSFTVATPRMCNLFPQDVDCCLLLLAEDFSGSLCLAERNVFCGELCFYLLKLSQF